MGLFDAIESSSEPVGDASECKGLIYRLQESSYQTGAGFEFRQRLTLQKRMSCTGNCEGCDWLEEFFNEQMQCGDPGLWIDDAHLGDYYELKVTHSDKGDYWGDMEPECEVGFVRQTVPHEKFEGRVRGKTKEEMLAKQAKPCVHGQKHQDGRYCADCGTRFHSDRPWMKPKESK